MQLPVVSTETKAVEEIIGGYATDIGPHSAHMMRVYERALEVPTAAAMLGTKLVEGMRKEMSEAMSLWRHFLYRWCQIVGILFPPLA